MTAKEDSRPEDDMSPAFLKFLESGRDPAAVLYSVEKANERGVVHPFQNGSPSDYDCAKMLVEIRAANELESIRKTPPTPTPAQEGE